MKDITEKELNEWIAETNETIRRLEADIKTLGISLDINNKMKKRINLYKKRKALLVAAIPSAILRDERGAV